MQGDSETVVAVESTDVLGNKRASYQDYVELWRHLVDPTKLKVRPMRSLSATRRLLVRCNAKLEFLLQLKLILCVHHIHICISLMSTYVHV